MLDFIKSMIIRLSEFEDYILWALIFGGVHTLFSPKNRTLMAYFISFITAIPVGVLAGLFAEEQGLGPNTTYVVTAVGALTANDLVKFILGVSGFLQEHSQTVAKTILEILVRKHNRKK